MVPRTSVKSGQLGLGPAAGSVLTYATSLPGLDHRDLSSDLEVLVDLSEVALVPLLAALALLAFAINWAVTRGSAALRSLLVVALSSTAAAVGRSASIDIAVARTIAGCP